jgi:hypothetical protein
VADQELIVRIIGDDRSLQQSLNRSTRAVTQFEGRTNKSAQGIRGALTGAGAASGGALLFGSAAFVGTAALTAGITKSVKAASDLNEEISKSRQVFGASSAAVESWARTTAQGIGISRTEALRATGTFGNLFRVIDIAPEKAAEMSRGLVQLAADLASFNNANPSDVLLALRSGLIGEAEPLRRYGVLLSEARVQQVALANTGKTNVKTLTDQEKALARYQIILSDTASAQGDFKRTSEGLANQTRILKANLNDLAASMGTTFLPAVNAAIGAVNDLFSVYSALFNLGGLKLDLSTVDISDLSGIQEARDRIAALKGESDLLVVALDQVIARLRELAGPIDVRTSRGGSERGGEQTASDIAKEGQAVIDRITRQANASLNQQITNVGKRIAHLKELIREDPTNVKLQQRLSEELATQNSLIARQKSLNESNASAAKAAADAAHDAAVRAAQDQREAEQAAVKRRAEQRKAQQFKDLGLTSEGAEKIPGAGSLLGRAKSLQDQIKGTPLDTSQTQAQLQRIIKVLKTNFKTAGRDVREAILDMLNEISGALSGKGKAGAIAGVQTGFVKRGIGKLLEGLGLSPEQVKELEQRFAQQGPGGTVPGKGTSAFGFAVQPKTASTVRPEGESGREQVFHIYIDGEEVEARVTRRQQKKRGRAAASRRGTRPGI